MKIVIDSGYFMNISVLPILKGDMYTTASILDEFKSLQTKSILELIQEKNIVNIMEPSKHGLSIVEKKIKKMGQVGLSKQDKEILALACDLAKMDEVVIATDDYAIKNISHSLNFKTMSSSNQGGNEIRKYYFKCIACGLVTNLANSNCDNCGHNKFKRFWKKI